MQAKPHYHLALPLLFLLPRAAPSTTKIFDGLRSLFLPRILHIAREIEIEQSWVVQQ